uniref:Uncharacterized protein n=1 Tax=Zea mays TaxID=4577 RepID=C0P9B5_MAIZE|nr:unknown [Zea mays]
MVGRYISKNRGLFKIIPRYWVSFAPNKKKSTRNPQRRCACLLPCGQITNLLSRFTRCFSPDLKISDTVT